MLDQSPIKRSETATELSLEWNASKAPHDRFLLWFLRLFWIVWTPMTMFATWMIFHSGSTAFLSIWIIFGWLGTLGIPYVFLQRSWREWVTLSSSEFVHGQQGPLAPKPKRIPLNAISEIGIGHHQSSEGESVVTLNIHYLTQKQRKVRRIVGYWLHSSLKEEVFHDLQAFARKHHLAVTFQRY